ncbi:MarR family winged helix-turn-helix transcriptional regulator [Actinomadura rupiterrae]|uniref:MarR family winged helix-turn-helix transcriptional regulator n=1 Tax=Actinomadura rupiterrae TaxID=559627 RepID=UPI0020A4E549|nr:MarR family transcriptional regulator [Actinomadura rupiterrae]MCP2343793.1 DNA-binding MarR family transcriptional regulator [Actinomadura rupiterrae]
MERSAEQAPEQVGESAVRAAREVRVVFSRLRRRLREIGGDKVLTPSQTSVLSRLAQRESMTASELAVAEGVRPQSMAATLAALEGHGVVRREADPNDGRRQLVSLTDRGLEFIAGSRQAREEWMARTLQQDFTEAERQTLLEALTLMDRLAQS